MKTQDGGRQELKNVLPGEQDEGKTGQTYFTLSEIYYKTFPEKSTMLAQL